MSTEIKDEGEFRERVERTLEELELNTQQSGVFGIVNKGAESKGTDTSGGIANTTNSWKLRCRIAATTFQTNFPDIDTTAATWSLVSDLAEGDRVLLTGELNDANNGIYVCREVTTAPRRRMERSEDFNNNTNAYAQSSVFISDGIHADEIWYLETIEPILLDSTNLIWRQFKSGQDPIILNAHDEGTLAGPGVTIDWSTFNFHYSDEITAASLTVTFSNPPPTAKYEPLILQFKQDAVGGRDVVFADTFKNGFKPFVDTQPLAVTTWVFHTDGGQNFLGFNTVSEESIPSDMTDETSVLGMASSVTPFYTFFADFSFYVTEVIISLNEVATGGAALEVDIKKNGITIFSTKPTIDVGDNLSTEGAPLSVISTPQISKNDKIELFMTVRGDSGNTARGLKGKLIGVIN